MIAKLEAVYKMLPGSRCPAGCGKCCGPIFPSLAELRNIKEYCQVHHIEYKDFEASDFEKDCPYLTEEKACRIYPARPFLCRVVAVVNDLPCPLKLCVPARVLNGPVSKYLYDEIYMRGKDKPRTEKHAAVFRARLAELIKQKKAVAPAITPAPR